MATREEILIGYQLISKANNGNDVLYNVAHYLQGVEPYTDKPLVEPVAETAECDCKVVDIEVETRLRKFLERYHDKQQINRGLAWFSTPRGCVERDAEEAVQHTSSVRTALALLDEQAALAENGKLLSLYKETVDLYMQPEIHLAREDLAVIAYQDVLNAIVFELQGVCSYTGEPKYLDLESRTHVCKQRMKTARGLRKQVPDTQEMRELHKWHDLLEEELHHAEALADLQGLGEHLSSKIPQLPLVRRWWAF